MTRATPAVGSPHPSRHPASCRHRSAIDSEPNRPIGVSLDSNRADLGADEKGWALMSSMGVVERSPPSDLDGRRVLVVEDEVIVAFSIECEVEDAGGEIVGPAHTLEEATRLIDEPIDVAILDINLNGESVWPIAQALRDRGVPYVLASANCDDPHAIDPAHSDVPRFDKPVALRRLVATVADLANSADAA
jgi:CheY-like chemotaxis protein